MVLESPERLGEFLLERYRRSRERYGNVFERPRDVHDMQFPAFVADNARRIHSIAVQLRDAFPHISEEKHALMAYMLHVLSSGEPLLGTPHSRIIRAPRRFFLDYLREAVGDDAFSEIVNRYKYSGVPVSELTLRTRLELHPSVLKRRFFLR